MVAVAQSVGDEGRKRGLNGPERNKRYTYTAGRTDRKTPRSGLFYDYLLQSVLMFGSKRSRVRVLWRFLGGTGRRRPDSTAFSVLLMERVVTTFRALRVSMRYPPRHAPRDVPC